MCALLFNILLIIIVIVRWMISCNVSFRSIDNQHLAKFITMLRPGYRLPGRKDLAGPILDGIYNKEFTKMVTQVSGCMATLMLVCPITIWQSCIYIMHLQDGWSTKSNDPVLAATVQVNGQTYLVGADDTTGCPHTSQYLLSVLEEYLQRAQDELNVHVVCVTTDSASNMVHMKELAAAEGKCPGVVFAPCMAHWLNLLAKDLCAESAMVDRIVTILKWFDRNHGAHAGMPHSVVTVLCFFCPRT